MTTARDSSEKILIIGGGPAGLTAALALVEQGLKPLIVEIEPIVGGISRTINYKGNRMDIGGHRFFSKSERVTEWWLKMLPLQGAYSIDDIEMSRKVPLSEEIDAPNPEIHDRVMLTRSRLSRIYFLRKFFDYPISLKINTLRYLGLVRTFQIGADYIQALLSPIKPEKSLEDFMVNRFGWTLYKLFFKDYTEKLWGVECRDIEPEWGAQRIKGLSIGKSIKHALIAPVRKALTGKQGDTETSLIDRFMYPKLGPGQLWETVADQLRKAGCDILLNTEVGSLTNTDGRICSVEVTDLSTGITSNIKVSSVMSTMPIKDLIGRIEGELPPEDVRNVAGSLPYRDFITCGLLVSQLTSKGKHGQSLLDNWIYIQEPDVNIGRLQIFNNWSPYLVADRAKIWLGLEYFCNEGDLEWCMSDDDFVNMAIEELSQIGIINPEDVLDSTVVRIKKAYPAYFGAYRDFSIVRDWISQVENLYLMGRNGMHRYNNMDHSMLSAWAAVDALTGAGSREAAWCVNTEGDYHESE